MIGLAPLSEATPTSVVVTVLPDGGNSSAISPSFAGFSFDVNKALRMIGSKGDNSVYAQLLRNMRVTSGDHDATILRIGGSGADQSCFINSSAAPGVSAAGKCTFYNITDRDLDAYMAFATGVAEDVNISYALGVNFGLSSDPAYCAEGHVQRMAEKGMWGRIESIEIGNEVDCYAKSHQQYRGSVYDYTKYESETNTFMEKLRAVGLPHQKVQGGVYNSYSTTFQKNIGRYLDTFSEDLRTFCYHAYAVGGCGGHNATMEELLSDSRWLPNGTLKLEQYISQARERGIPFVLGESNSVSCGGKRGVSDTFATALWVPHFFAELSKGGVQRVNIHGGALEIYSPIRFKSHVGLLVEPLYYGMLAFSELTANHSRWLKHTQSAPAPQFVAHAAVNIGGDVKVLLIAKDLTQKGTPPRTVSVCLASIAPSRVGETARVFALTAPSINSNATEGVKYAGQTFQGSKDGNPIGDRVHVSVTGDVRGGQMCFDCMLQPLSAALVVVTTLPRSRPA
jgi:hypothetical protein